VASVVQIGARMFILVLLIVILALGGLLWFDYLGLIQAKPFFSPVMGLFGMDVPEKAPESGRLDTLMLEKERLAKQIEALDIRNEELENHEESLRQMEAELVQKMEVLEERESELKEREISFNQRLKQYENIRANLRQSAAYFNGMPPQQAVDRMLEMEDQDVIDILRMSEEMAAEAGQDSIVSFWLSLMPPERAAVLSRKMIKQP
jgi:flagellar protein FlbB